ncbi:hypothetical protein, partial [Sinorhizobium meliloti]|uniref:hypothetical protein n=1 Tax=Rhizobium meliloti TaxID=382 RepID=UPI001AECDCCC
LQRADTDDGGSIIKAEIHLAKRPKLFRQTEPALPSVLPLERVDFIGFWKPLKNKSEPLTSTHGRALHLNTLPGRRLFGNHK